MPTSYWLECLRDNVVFPVYLYQKWFHLWIKAERTYLRSFTRKSPRGNRIQTKRSSTSGEPLCSWLQAEQSLDLVLWKHCCNSLDNTSLAFPELLNVPHRSPYLPLCYTWKELLALPFTTFKHLFGSQRCWLFVVTLFIWQLSGRNVQCWAVGCTLTTWADTWSTGGTRLSIRDRKDIALVSSCSSVNFKCLCKFIPFGFPGIKWLFSFCLNFNCFKTYCIKVIFYFKVNLPGSENNRYIGLDSNYF